MDILSTKTTLPSTSISLGDVSDAVTSLPFERLGDAFDSITPDLDDVGDFAAAVASTGTRVGLRTVRSTVRVVRRNPRYVGGAIATLIALTALAIFMKKRRETSDSFTND